MAQRKSPPGKPATSPAAKKAAAQKAVAKAGGGSRPGAARPAGARPPAKKPGKSIVNQKQTPWGLIGVTAAIVVFAAVIVIAVVVTRKGDSSSKSEAGSAVGSCTKMDGTNSTSYLNELVCAKDIKGVVFKPEAGRSHVSGLVKYDTTPPIGGNHNGTWADCDGTVYDAAIANENAVHMLEHGAVWITYNASTIKPSDLTTLKKLVDGQPRMALSPYPDLDSAISLQAWGYQLKLSSASDPRLDTFVNALRYNPKTTPEYGAVCSDPAFKLNPSTFGHPTS